MQPPRLQKSTGGQGPTSTQDRSNILPKGKLGMRELRWSPPTPPPRNKTIFFQMIFCESLCLIFIIFLCLFLFSHIPDSARSSASPSLNNASKLPSTRKAEQNILELFVEYKSLGYKKSLCAVT